MYICDKCKSNSKPREAQCHLVVQTRKKSYQNKYKTKKGYRTKTSEGWEIVKELNLCGDCYDARSQ